MPLAETQRRLRDAMVLGEWALAESLLAGGARARTRLAIHLRHYEASLVTSLLERFPATAWLVGSAPLVEAARAFVRRHPPAAPCIAEYGTQFPEFLGEGPLAERVPYLRGFARLEWRLGRVSVEVDGPALGLEAVSALAPETLVDASVEVQAGTEYLAADWSVDEVMTRYLTDTAADGLVVSPAPVWLEIRGARGAIGFSRLEESQFVFRTAVRDRCTLGEASELALVRDATFDPGRALASLFTEGLATAIRPPAGE